MRARGLVPLPQPRSSRRIGRELPPVEPKADTRSDLLATIERGASLEMKVRAAIPDKLKSQTDARYAAIAPLIDNDNGMPLPAPFRTREQLAAYLGKQQRPPVSSRAIRDWYQRFRDAQKAGNNPYAALADRVRSDAGQSRFFGVHPLAAAFVEKKKFNERLSITLAHEALCREWAQFRCEGPCAARRRADGSHEPCTPPDADTVRRYLNKVPKPVQTLALRGPRAWQSDHAPTMLREVKRAMDWWVLDHRQLDVDCRNTMFDTLAPGEMYRPWVTAIGDWGSRAWVGFCFSPGPSWRTIGSAIRTAISEYGLPRNFYWDNGKDFQKVQRILKGHDLGEEFGDALSTWMRDNRVAFGFTDALPYRPGSKPIESWFSTMSKRFDLIWGAAYQGHSTAHRTEFNEAAQKRHAKYMAGKALSTPMPADYEVIAGAITWMLRENNRPRRNLDGRTPFQVLEEQHPPEARRVVGRDLLNVLFCERDRRKVGKGGCVKLSSRVYEPTDASLGALSVREGEEIVVLRDPYALEEAAALDSKTLAFIGELRLQEFVAQCPNGHVTRDQIQAHARRVAGLRKMYSGYLAWLAALGEAHSWKSERDVLLEEAGLRTGTDNALALPPGVAPGARQPRAGSSERQDQQFDSPFVSDAVPRLIEAMNEVPRIAPAFVSDAVDSDGVLDHIELEEESS